jgi:hypothetical protein
MFKETLKKNLSYEMCVRLLGINDSVKRVVSCLKMQNNLKITMDLVLAQSEQKQELNSSETRCD